MNTWAYQHRDRSIWRSLQVALCFCVVGFANAVVPNLVFSAAYLIIPYPRPIVILLQTFPAVVAKLSLPGLVGKVPYWSRALAIALGWVISCVIINSSTPNVPPAPRILAVTLASVSSALGEVTWLGLLRYHGKLGLGGWAVGTGLAAMFLAALPYALTVQMGLLLSTGVSYSWYLIPSMLIAHSFIIPQHDSASEAVVAKEDMEMDAGSPTRPLLGIFDRQASLCHRGAVANWRLTKSLLKPYVIPLILSGIGQAATYPGFSRAMGVSSPFPTFPAYAAMYGLAFQSGNLAARFLFVLIKAPKARTTVTILGFALLTLGYNAASMLTASPTVIFPVVAIAGLATGSIYVGTLAAALERSTFMSGSDREFSLGFVGVGESAGLILGGIGGALLEGMLCSARSAHNTRWCYV